MTIETDPADAPNTDVAPRRVRRTAEEARRVILDAAESRLVRYGPEGIRLQDIAADVGISHPAILHHFGSREGLVHELISRVLGDLKSAVVDRMERARAEGLEQQNMIDLVFDVLGDQGGGRLYAWLALSGRAPEDPLADHLVNEATDTLHEVRKAIFPDLDVPREDTLFVVMLAGKSAFGEAIAGANFNRAAGLADDPEANTRFRRWFGKMLGDHLQYGPRKDA